VSLENDAAGRSRSAGAAACRSGERGEHDNEGEEDLAYTRHDELHSVGDWAKRAYCTSVEWAIAGRIRTVSHSGLRVYQNAIRTPYAEQWAIPAPDFSAFTDPLTLITNAILTRFAPGQAWCPR
jgi:hypothetical protein